MLFFTWRSAIRKDRSAYRLSFIGAGLLPHYAADYIDLYSSTGDWDKTRQLGQERNLVQARTLSSAKRVGHELILRLRHLRDNELALFGSCDAADKNYLLWLAICRAYSFIGDFMRQHMRQKLHYGDPNVSRDDFNVFYNQQVEKHPELDKISPSSRIRMGFCLMRLMREAGILDGEGVISRASPGPELKALLDALPYEERLFFPGLIS